MTTGVPIRVGEAARQTGTTPRTVRYYEELGLVSPTKRVGRGSRLYSDSELERIRAIKALQAFGFSLSDIKTMFLATKQSPSGRDKAHRLLHILRDKIVEAQRKIRAYQRVKREMEQTMRLLASWCSECERVPLSECPMCPVAAESEPLSIGKELMS
jgi:DNA-binding transcriptional MerR regulator